MERARRKRGALHSRRGAEDPHRIPVRVLSSKACDLRFYFNGLRVPANQIRIEKDYALIDHNIAEPRIVTLSWTCHPLAAAADPRLLGLAIKKIEVIG